MEKIIGGVTAAKGFIAGGVHCGMRRNQSKLDLGMIYCEVPCNAAAVYTQNLVKGAPVSVTKAHLEDGKAQAVIVNSGNANTCNADGIAKAERMSELAAEALHISPEDVIVASTGVIGQVLPIAPIEQAVQGLADSLAENGSEQVAKAIMTTDTFHKEAAVSCVIDGKTVCVGGVAKGSGMIHPNMATLLSFVSTDCAISVPMLQKAIGQAVGKTFNCLSIDGDTSTNDTFTVMSSGLAGNSEITSENDAGYQVFLEALTEVCRMLVMMLAKDGEGATKLIVCKAQGAKTEAAAKAVSKSVICSSLFKAMMFGEDANWGRIMCAIGYSGVDIDITKVDVSLTSEKGELEVCKDGAGIDFSEERASAILAADEITVTIQLNEGKAEAEAFGCDLTYDYVKINGDYRT